MSFALKLKDQTSSGDVIAETIVRFPAEQITVRQLIETRVTQEVDAYHANRDDAYGGLIQLVDDEVLLNGVKLRQGARVNAEEEIGKALEAFEKGDFFLLVNDKQLTGLDQQILITPNTKVVFLKLVRLVGG